MSGLLRRVDEWLSTYESTNVGSRGDCARLLRELRDHTQRDPWSEETDPSVANAALHGLLERLEEAVSRNERFVAAHQASADMIERSATRLLAIFEVAQTTLLRADGINNSLDGVMKQGHAMVADLLGATRTIKTALVVGDILGLRNEDAEAPYHPLAPKFEVVEKTPPDESGKGD